MDGHGGRPSPLTWVGIYMDRQDGQDGRLCRGGGYAWAWIAAYAGMTGAWARFIAPLRRRW